tara:strand:- start:6253 stop:6648 length:396 start_codon:yes stop_codon:yes gene_type:complete
MDLLDQYIKELGEDTALDEFNVRDVQMKLPAIKHKWAGRLMRAKSDNSKLERKKKKVIKDLTQKLVKDSPVKLSLPIAEKKVQDLDDIQDIDEQIRDNEVVILFLEKAERILNSMTFDIKNLTEIMKLETT